MRDSYLNFANTRFGNKLTSMLGLPQPRRLARYSSSQVGHGSSPGRRNARLPIIEGKLILGATQDSEMLCSLIDYFKTMSVDLEVNSSLHELSEYNQWQAGSKVKALVFDASGLDNSAASISLHHFFKQTVRSVVANGRVIIIGRAPSDCIEPSKAIAQRAT